MDGGSLRVAPMRKKKSVVERAGARAGDGPERTRDETGDDVVAEPVAVCLLRAGPIFIVTSVCVPGSVQTCVGRRRR